MPADIKTQYPSTDTTALTITLASLPSDTNLLAGQESTAVDNTTNEDLDHLVSGRITLGTSPTASRVIEVWAYAPVSVILGTKTYPDVLDGTDSAETLTSTNVKVSALVRLWSTSTDNTTDRAYYMPPKSIAQAFGAMPTFWGLFVVHSTGVNLNSTAGNQYFHYLRIQAQTI